MKELLKRIAKALDDEGLAYMVIGGQAVLIYGEPRFTRDIDITVLVTPQNLNKVLEVVRRAGLEILVDDDIEKFVKDTWVLPAYDPDSGFRVDFIFSWTPYEKQAVERGRVIEVLGYPVKFASPEDIIILKMISGRGRDLEDIAGIVRRVKNLDIEYIFQWLEAFEGLVGRNLRKEFRKILQEEGR